MKKILFFSVILFLLLFSSCGISKEPCEGVAISHIVEIKYI